MSKHGLLRLRNLDGIAPRLEQTDIPGLFRLVAPGSTPILYVDPEQATQAVILDWLRHCRCNLRGGVSNLAPLYVNGFTKSGKSLVINKVLLSLVREDPVFGVGQPDEVSVFQLSMDSLPKVCALGPPLCLRYVVILMVWRGMGGLD